MYRYTLKIKVSLLREMFSNWLHKNSPKWQVYDTGRLARILHDASPLESGICVIWRKVTTNYKNLRNTAFKSLEIQALLGDSDWIIMKIW